MHSWSADPVDYLLTSSIKQTLLPVSIPLYRAPFSLVIQLLDVSKEAARLLQLGVAVAKVPANNNAGLAAANDSAGIVL